jgi:polysaccharide deacetylase 2 family uncharacterized protein YibQ
VSDWALPTSQTIRQFRLYNNPDTHCFARVLARSTLLFALAACLAGCKKPEHGLRAKEIHAITMELADAAANAAPPRHEVREKFSALDEFPGRTDGLDITLDVTESPATKRDATVRLIQALTMVATRHGLTQDSPSESREGILYSYRHAGIPTHTIHVHFGSSPQADEASSSSQTSARLAIILDDLGNDRAAAEAIFALPYHLTISVLPDHAHSAEIAEEAHRRGYEVMLHLPMQSVGNEKPEAQELHPGMTTEDVTPLVNQMLRAVPYAVGVNNHQGSQATSDPALMSELMPILRDRQLFYIDSRTSATTVAFDTARENGVRCAFRNVPFLDDVAEVNAVRKQLELALRGAREKGEAVAIGHPHPATLQALSQLVPHAEAQGVHLVFASDLVH